MTGDRAAPHSIEAEAAVLGAILVDERVLPDVREIVAAEDFYREAHRTIYRAMVDLSDDGGSVDPVTTFDRLGTDGIERVGGSEYLAALLDAVPTATNVADHARIVASKATLRRVIAACTRTIEDTYGLNGEDPAVALSRAEARLLEVLAPRRPGVGYLTGTEAVQSGLDAVRAAYEARKAGGIVGVPTGIPKLDHLMAGLHPGDLTILAGRPSMGKTSLCCGMLDYAAGRGHPGALASYEMSRAQIVLRALSAGSGVDAHDLRSGRIDASQGDRIKEAGAKLATRPLWIDDRPGPTVEELRSGVRRLLVREPGLRILAIDYLQQMTAPNERGRNAEIEHITRSLKRLARELGLHVLALSQLNRAVEHRKPPRPQLADLRDSGSIEQDADTVLALWRPEYYFGDETSEEARAEWTDRGELLVLKQRGGATGRVRLRWDARTTRFSELAAEPT